MKPCWYFFLSFFAPCLSKEAEITHSFNDFNVFGNLCDIDCFQLYGRLGNKHSNLDSLNFDA